MNQSVREIVVANSAALILIDLQVGFLHTSHWGVQRHNPQAEQVCSGLLQYWRAQQWPVFHTQHHSQEESSFLHPSHPGCAFQECVRPLSNEAVIVKNVNSAFIDTTLRQDLYKLGITTLVMVGLTTDHCVSTTARMAGNFGFRVFVVEDATGTFDRRTFDGQHVSAETTHHSALASLHREFATVIKSTDIT